MKRRKVIFQAKLVVGYWELIPTESGGGFSAPQETVTVRVAKEIPPAKKQRTSWWTEDNWPRLKKALMNSRCPDVIEQCGEYCLDLGFYLFPKQTLFNVYRVLEGIQSHMIIPSL